MKETDLLNAWLWEKHRTDIQWRHVRLGVLPTKEMARMYMSMLRWVDAIYIKDGVVYLVEAKLRPQPGAISQLELYGKLFPQTPEFHQYRDWPIQLVLLSAMPDLPVIEMCSERSIEFEVFDIDQINEARRKMMLPTV